MKQIKKRSALGVCIVALGLLLGASTVLAEKVIVDDKGYVTKINNLKVIDDLGKTVKYNVKFKYDTAANLYKKNGFDFKGEEDAFSALGDEGVDRVCAGECYHPSDRRRAISRIEVVRVLPQAVRGEPVAPLIQDPWKVHQCDGDPAGCSVVFSDPDYHRGGRDAVYYVRAVEAPAPGINVDGLRCERDASGSCTRVDICGLDGDSGDDCLGEAEPKAWSSPIFVDWSSQAG